MGLGHGDRTARGDAAEDANDDERARLTRRAILAVGAGVTTATLAVFRVGSDQSATIGAARQEGPSLGTPPFGSPETSSIAATPVATPATTPTANGLDILTAPFPRDADPATRGGRLRLTIGSTLANFNPVAGGADSQVELSYLDSLVTTDPATMAPISALATDWAWNSDSTEITFTLRDDVRWHDGSPLTPEDVRFSFLVYREDINGGYGRFFDLLREIEIIDDRRVRVRLSEADGGWLANAATRPIFQGAQYQSFWSNQPEGDRTLDGFDWEVNSPVGTGPWRVTEWRERRIEFAANSEYWNGGPLADSLVLTTFEDGEARLQRWRSGDADIVWPVSPAAVGSLMDEEGRLYVCDSATVRFAAFNFANAARDVPGLPGLLDDRRLRRAMSVAIDRERYARDVFGGYVQQDRSGTIAQPWANDSALTNPPHNRIAAEALLTGGAYVDRDGDGVREAPDGTPLNLVAIVQDDGPAGLEATLRSAAEDLAEVGIAVDVQSMDDVSFNERWQVTHDFDLVAFGYRLFPGFTDFDLYGSAWDIRTNLQGWNPGGYSNGDVDDVIAEILSATDLDDQAELLRRLQTLVDDDLFGLWFGFPQDLVLVAPHVLGFKPAVDWQTRDTRSLWIAPG